MPGPDGKQYQCLKIKCFLYDVRQLITYTSALVVVTVSYKLKEFHSELTCNKKYSCQNDRCSLLSFEEVIFTNKVKLLPLIRYLKRYFHSEPMAHFRWTGVPPHSTGNCKARFGSFQAPTTDFSGFPTKSPGNASQEFT